MFESVAIYLLNGLFFASILFLIASGLNLIFSIAGIVNLAHGALYMLGAYIAAVLIKQFVNTPYLPLAFILAAIMVGLVGLAIERGTIRLVYDKHYTLQLLLTFGLALILSDVVRMIFGTEPISAGEPYMRAGTINLLGISYPLYNFLVIGITILIALFMWYLLYKTRLGKVIRACAISKEMSEALGINTSRVFASSFLLGALLAGLSGALVVPPTVAMLGIDADALIDAFIVVVIGGIGSLKGSFIGALIVGITRAFGIVYFPELELAVPYIVMAVILLVRPRGLFGRELRVA